MIFTPEHLNSVADGINDLDEAAQEELVDNFAERQPDILAYIMSEDAETLGDEEAEMLLFVATIFWQAAEREKGKTMPAVTADDIDALQDANWKLFDDNERPKGMSMSEFVNPIIEAYSEPELLYFIVDVFEQDEAEADEFAIQEAAQVPMFVMLKTVADALIEITKPL